MEVFVFIVVYLIGALVTDGIFHIYYLRLNRKGEINYKNTLTPCQEDLKRICAFIWPFVAFVFPMLVVLFVVVTTWNTVAGVLEKGLEALFAPKPE